MFIGRERELNTLDNLYESNKFEFAVIYGRRSENNRTQHVGEAGRERQRAYNHSGNTGFVNISLEVDYDASVMTLSKVEENSESGADYVASQYTTVNPYVLTWNSIVNTVFDGTLVTMNFKIKYNVEAGGIGY